MTTAKTTPKKRNNIKATHQRSKAKVNTNKKKTAATIIKSSDKTEAKLSLGEVFSTKLNLRTKLPLYKLSNMKNLLKKNNNYKPDHGSHQAKMTEELDKLCVDMKLVDALKLVQKHETPSWFNIVEVGKNLAKLGEQHKVTTNTKTKKEISELMSKFELQNKKLLKEHAEGEAKKRSKKGTATDPKPSN